MKRNSFLIPISILILTLSAGTAFCDLSDDPSWHVKKTEHFIISYHDAPIEYIEEVANYAEKYYSGITNELGFTRYDSFWTWENRAKIYIFNDSQEYQTMARQPDWSGAGVDIYTREIMTFVNMRHFYAAILPHELAHIIFREFVGHNKRLPLWMDEGVASYVETDYRGKRVAVVRGIIGTKDFMPLDELSKVTSLNRFISPDVFYAEAASLIEFLISAYGTEKFFEFSRNLRDLRKPKTWVDAAINAYGFKDMADMNEKWLEFLKK